MTTLTRIEPREEAFLEPLPDMFRRFMRMATADWPSMRVADDIRLDISETDKEYLVKAELPGVKKEDISVTVDGDYVCIRAEVKDERKEAKKHDGEHTLLHEMHFGSMSRGFTLPQDVDDKATEAKFENGVLSLTLPKRAPTATRKIAIK